jgi:hypothetical protein
LYLLRALSAWQWEEALHAVLLPAAMAALQGKAVDMQLQVKLVIAAGLRVLTSTALQCC